MKYRHSFHAGNFADVHKHVTLLALLAALQRKEKGFLYLDTHAGHGVYEIADPRAAAERAMAASQAGAINLAGLNPRDEPIQAHGREPDRSSAAVPELDNYAAAIVQLRKRLQNSRAYPGSPLLAAETLRPQDRAVCIELQAAEARSLQSSVAANARVRVECADGFDRLRAYLPPSERRGLTLIDPPYEETSDFDRTHAAIEEAVKRFATGVILWWYPIKDDREMAGRQASLAARVHAPALLSELWLYPRDSRIALNGSGLLIVNPPWQIEDRMRLWLPELYDRLQMGPGGGVAVRSLLDRS